MHIAFIYRLENGPGVCVLEDTGVTVLIGSQKTWVINCHRAGVDRYLVETPEHIRYCNDAREIRAAIQSLRASVGPAIAPDPMVPATQGPGTQELVTSELVTPDPMVPTTQELVTPGPKGARGAKKRP